MKLRTPGSKLFIDTINAMGATATSLPFSETLSGVSQGVVDGLEGSEFTNIGTKCYEHCKNVATTKHFLGTCGVYISTKVWDKLSPEDQKIVAEEFAYGGKEMTKISTESYDKVYKELESKGVKFNDVDHALLKKQLNLYSKKWKKKKAQLLVSMKN
ncbi:MAG: TRAP transporter substrate-binding protein DctP [Phascolarctobacterium sp.]